ncbi:MAG: hypothetical protein IPH98_10245 [Saprospiraceae bacterium]|nr:hypothetical protein [Candidatus Defluviibacterium haderslevense]
MIEVNKHRKDYLNNKANEIVGFIQNMPKIQPNHNLPFGSKGEKRVLDITDQLKDKPQRFRTQTISDKPIDCIEEYQQKTYGLNEDSYKKYEKLIDSIYEEKTISKYISIKFIDNNSMEWIFATYRQEINISFVDYLLPILDNSIETYKFTYRILNLDIESFFEVGNCLFHFYKEKELSSLEEEFRDNDPDKAEYNKYSLLKKDYLGIPLISTQTMGEFGRAEELAKAECSLSIDTLKLCSLTTIVPDYKIYFDLDERVKYNSRNTNFTTVPEDKEYFTITFSGNKGSYDLDPKEWQDLQSRNLGQFHKFLKNRHLNRNELSDLIENSITMYAEAITQTDLNNRIVNLFTILESFLLKNDDSTIIDSVTKYLPKLIFKKLNERKEIIELLKRLYKVRSAKIHHAKKNKFDIIDLRKLQISIVSLLLSLISKITEHETKHSILEQIDENILNA